jgi:histidine ammonia-lyase
MELAIMIELCDRALGLIDIHRIIHEEEKICIAEDQMRKIRMTYELIQRSSDSQTPIYGINTGFGALAEKIIPQHQREELQKNIILSHAVGVGKPLDFKMALAMILLRLNTLLKGYSGASPVLIDHLVALINNRCAPLIPSKGSVGASGDLAPLAHLGLLLLGIGDALLESDEIIPAHQALKKASIKPIQFGMRDGLALINGTQAMAAVGVMAIIDCSHLADAFDLAAASSLDALAGHETAFDERIHLLKSHPGQLHTASNIRKAIRGRTIHLHVKNQLTQDPYSLRCIPQVHGASRDAFAFAQEVILRELNSVTDNPLIFVDEKSNNFEILSGGNFHGQHLALALDFLAMGVSELANIAERRVELLLNPQHSHGLPPFLIEDSGLNSGYMMLQVLASALINENKILCHPASTDSIPTSANREDHVSMGMTSANKLTQVIENSKTVLAIDLRTKGRPGEGIIRIHDSLRSLVPFRKNDGLYRDDVAQTLFWLSRKETEKLMDEIIGCDHKPRLGITWS